MRTLQGISRTPLGHLGDIGDASEMPWGHSWDIVGTLGTSGTAWGPRVHLGDTWGLPRDIGDIAHQQDLTVLFQLPLPCVPEGTSGTLGTSGGHWGHWGWHLPVPQPPQCLLNVTPVSPIPPIVPIAPLFPNSNVPNPPVPPDVPSVPTVPTLPTHTEVIPGTMFTQAAKRCWTRALRQGQDSVTCCVTNPL